MRVYVSPGTPLSDVRRRVVGRGFWFPSPSDQGVVAASSSRASATVTTGAAHTKGSWVELVTATTKDVTLVTVGLTGATNVNATNTSALLDIGIGAAASEVAVVSNLAVGYKAAGDRYDIPVVIPAGSRISARAQNAAGATSILVGLVLGNLPYSRRPPNHIVTMGDDTATSHGVGLPTPVANTKTAWTQIIASTAEPFGGLIVGEQGNADTSFSNGTALLDIAVAASGSEASNIVLADLAYTATSLELYTPLGDRNFPVDIPMGSRIAARWASSINTNSMDLILYGVPRQ